MLGRIHEQHLLQHHLGKGLHEGEPKAIQVIQGRRSIGGVIHQNMNHFRVAGDDPGMHVRVPMHGVMAAHGMVKGMRMGRYFRVEKHQETELVVLCC